MTSSVDCKYKFWAYFFNSCTIQGNIQAIQLTGLPWWQKLSLFFQLFLQDLQISEFNSASAVRFHSTRGDGVRFDSGTIFLDQSKLFSYVQQPMRLLHLHTRLSPCVPLFCSYHILTSSVTYYWTDARQHGIYLFYIIKKQTTTEKAFFISKSSTWLESWPLPCTPPTLTNTKKAIWHNLLSLQLRQSHWLLYVGKEFWLVQENRATVKPDSSVASCGMKTYSKSKIELRNSTNLEEKAGKIETVFVIRTALWAE